jgi:anti-anti-sigma regulatory factor
VGKIGASEWFSVTTGACEGIQVVVVRGGVEFISSAGIHVLLRERPRPPALASPPGNVARVLEIVRAGRRVPVFDDLDSAVRSLTLRRSA